MTEQQPRGLRIFLVEDHPDTLEFFEMYLESLGHSVVHATGMAEALAAIPVADCDVLVSDVGLRDGTGWELLTALRESGVTHPSFTIALSGYGSAADRQRSVAAGFRYHLLKPLDPAKLEVLLEQAVKELSG